MITIDVSFISLSLVLPVVRRFSPRTDRNCAVKPQFPAGREVGAGGVVRDPSVHTRVIETVAASALQVGLTRLAVEPSPITGTEGNREFLTFARRSDVTLPVKRVALIARLKQAAGAQHTDRGGQWLAAHGSTPIIGPSSGPRGSTRRTTALRIVRRRRGCRARLRRRHAARAAGMSPMTTRP
jgi:hypothetical protein